MKRVQVFIASRTRHRHAVLHPVRVALRQDRPPTDHVARFPSGSGDLFSLFQAITHFANPALEAASGEAPIVVLADVAECHFHFNPAGTVTFTS